MASPGYPLRPLRQRACPDPDAPGAAAAGVLLAAAGLAPAAATTGPSIGESGSSADIAVQGPDNSLKFYWADNGSPVTWNVENVALTGTYSAPSMAETGSSVNISAVGTSDSLSYYWAQNGTSTWIAEQVAPPGSVR
jgi:hypothetical protein